jgi:uncharacterized membrane protein YqjE
MLIQGKRAAGRGEGPGFFDLIERLFSDLGTLLDQKLTLLTIELKNEGAVVVRDLLMVLVGAVVVTLGLLFISIGAAVWIGAAIGSVPGGYGIVGGVFLLGGGSLLAVMRSRMEKNHLLPRKTLQEFRRDKQWIKDKF